MVVNQVRTSPSPGVGRRAAQHIAALIHDKTGYNLWQGEEHPVARGRDPRHRGSGCFRAASWIQIGIIIVLFAVRALFHAHRRPAHGRLLPRDTAFQPGRGLAGVMREVRASLSVRMPSASPCWPTVQGVAGVRGLPGLQRPEPAVLGRADLFATIPHLRDGAHMAAACGLWR